MFTWQAPEYEYFEKHPNWFWVVGIVAIVLLLTAILLKNLLFAIIILLAGFTVIVYGARRPDIITFTLANDGVRVGSRLYPYRHLKSFWVSDDPGRRQIIIESEKMLLPHLILPLADDVPAEPVREFLLKFLKEERHEDSFADLLADRLGF